MTASAKQRTMALALTLTVAGFAFTNLALAETSEMDTKPGPAYTIVDGKVSNIEGNVYTVQSESELSELGKHNEH